MSEQGSSDPSQSGFERVVGVFVRMLSVALLLAGMPSLAGAQAAWPLADVPVAFSTDIEKAELLPAPEGFVWHRVDMMQVAVVTPVGWHRYETRGPANRVVAFSPKALDQDNQFDVGFTARRLWHPQLRAGNELSSATQVLASLVQGIESNKTYNQVLRGTLEERANKKMLVVRHRNAAANLPPIVVHTVAVGDPLTGLVHEFIFESPESSWDDHWKVAEPIFRRIVILFQRG
jgi:hypothetical protein